MLKDPTNHSEKFNPVSLKMKEKSDKTLPVVR